MALADDVARYAADPSALVAEIARYTALKAEVDARLGAEVDVITAREQLANANKRLSEAEEILHKAQLERESLGAQARIDADRTRFAAAADSDKIMAEATAKASAIDVQAHEVSRTAAEKLSAVNDREAEAQRNLAAAQAMGKAAQAAEERFNRELEATQTLRAKLEQVKEQISASLGS